jgi:hypothetical protein
MEGKENPRKGCAALVLGHYLQRRAGVARIRQAWLPASGYAAGPSGTQAPAPVTWCPFSHAGLSPGVARVRAASQAWWRQAAAMLLCPASFKIPMARLRRVAMTWGPLPVRVWEASSP